MKIILSGIVGSTAYGLNNAESDVDYQGIFVESLSHVLSLRDFKETITTKDPDTVYHEAKKFCKLALKCNPSITELLWLTDYDVMTTYGQELVKIRQEFLSARFVRSAYLGYASSQFTRLARREGKSFSSDTAKRTAKHARHLARLLAQGYDLYATGSLDIRVSDPSWFFNFGEQVAAGDINIATRLLEDTAKKFNNTQSPLPDSPNYTMVNSWLVDLRMNLVME